MNMKYLWEGLKEALNLKVKVKIFLLIWLGAYGAFVAMYFLSDINNPIVFLIGCGIAGITAAPIYRSFAGFPEEHDDGVRSIPR